MQIAYIQNIEHTIQDRQNCIVGLRPYLCQIERNNYLSIDT
jgi:hypothetical protein